MSKRGRSGGAECGPTIRPNFVIGGIGVVTVTDVARMSAARKAGFLPGDIIISVNGNEINDVLDYRFFMTESRVAVKIHRGDKLLVINVEKDEYEDIGLGFSTFLMDEKKSCRNKCVFCFIDQLPRGMRDTLYFKDDDSRLSFLQGNYVTLTNMDDEDLRRIARMHMSPVNVSVHTTNPELRVKMMKNPSAARINEQISFLVDSGISLNCQIVVCRNINDGAELDRTMNDLLLKFPGITSVSVVPAGLTCHREGLCHLERFDAQSAAALISQVDNFGDICKEKYGCRLFYCADELYVCAGLPLPGEDYYDGYPQIQNGVGLITSMACEFDEAIQEISSLDLEKPRHFSIATGTAAYGHICALVEKASRASNGAVKCDVYAIKNKFFGESVTVAGLVCGCDILNELKGRDLGERLLIPDVMLRDGDDDFLDGMKRSSLEQELGVPVYACGNSGYDFLSSLLY